MTHGERRGGEREPPPDDEGDADHPAPRKNDEVPENRQDADVSRSDDDDERPRGDRRGS
jgi:hypothetical protein